MKFLILIFIFLIIHSCSNNSLKKDQPEGVDLDLSDQVNKKNNEVKPSEPTTPLTLKIGKETGSIANSNIRIDESRNSIKNEKANLRYGVNFGPGILHALTYVSVIKVFEKNNISPFVVTGSEFGSLIAALYASGETAESIEWQLFKFLKNYNNYPVYSDAWIEEIDRSFLYKIKNSNIQNLKHKLFLTLYNPKNHQTYIVSEGNVRDIVLLNFKLLNHKNEYFKASQYYSPVHGDIFNSSLLKKSGADFLIAIQSLSEKNEFEANSPTIQKLYNNAFKASKKGIANFNFVVNLPLAEMKLDSAANLPTYIQKSFQYAKKIFPSMKIKADRFISENFNQGVQ